MAPGYNLFQSSKTPRCSCTFVLCCDSALEHPLPVVYGNVTRYKSLPPPTLPSFSLSTNKNKNNRAKKARWFLLFRALVCSLCCQFVAWYKLPILLFFHTHTLGRWHLPETNSISSAPRWKRGVYRNLNEGRKTFTLLVHSTVARAQVPSLGHPPGRFSKA